MINHTDENLKIIKIIKIIKKFVILMKNIILHINLNIF